MGMLVERCVWPPLVKCSSCFLNRVCEHLLVSPHSTLLFDV